MNLFKLWFAQKQPYRVLLAEDEPETAILIAQFLKARGIQVDYAQNGLEALELAQKNVPDLVLMDIELPYLNGLDALAQLKADSKTQNIPVLMCTGQSRVHEVAEASQWGANGYITKPLNFDFLWDKIHTLLPNLSN
jgi:DNA-binding response OmpR family regulator